MELPEESGSPCCSVSDHVMLTQSVTNEEGMKYTLRACVPFCIFLLCCVTSPNALNYCKVTTTSILQASRKSHAYQEIWARKHSMPTKHSDINTSESIKQV